jgi:hypothetical protein
MSRRWAMGALGVLVVLAAVQAVVTGQAPSDRPKRARPPQFDATVTETIFFKDAFAEALIGERPADLGAGTAAGGGTGAPMGTPGGSSGPPATYAWSKIISADTLQDEIKTIKVNVDKIVTTPTDYAGGGYKKGRREFSMLALLFGIIAQYDGEVRWQKEALIARDLFGRAGQNSKVGTQQAYDEAKLRKQDLEDLVGGNGMQGQAGDPKPDWARIAGRSPLMQRIEMAHQGNIMPWTASDTEFKANKAKLLHEAELVAAVAEAIKQPGYEFADDSGYVKYCDRLRDAALEIVSGVKLDNFDMVRKGVGDISKVCSECHSDYRA